MISEEQRQALIAHNKAKIKAVTPHFLKEKVPGIKAHLNNELKSAKIALASLEAKPVATFGSVGGRWLGGVRSGSCLLYAAPPVQEDCAQRARNAEQLCAKWKEEAIKAHEENEELRSRYEALAVRLLSDR